MTDNAAPGTGQVRYAEDPSDQDLCRAIITAGERAGMWRPLGLEKGSYLLMRAGKLEALTPDEVLREPTWHFLKTYGP